MDVVYSTLLICLLLEASVSTRNLRFPHLHSLAMQHDNYQHYDSYSSEDMVLRSRRKKHHRKGSSDASNSEHNYKWQCKCSCVKCKKPKSCCLDFCAQQCSVQSNILVVPYPVPFMVHPMNVTGVAPAEALNPAPAAATVAQTVSVASTVSVLRTLSTTPTPLSRKTLEDILHKVTSPVFYMTKGYKRFRILPEIPKKSRRTFASNLRPAGLSGLPKYGIVPIPEKLAVSLMHQIRNDQRKNNFRQTFNVHKNLLDYAD